MTPTISAFRWVPPFAQGLVRDLRVRWALEEAGQPYRERLVSLGDEQKSPGYRALQPFGQVPVFQEGELHLFESGAIVLHVAEKSPALMPADDLGRELVRTWLFAALNTVEPPISMLHVLLQQKVEPTSESFTFVVGWIEKRLHELEAYLGGREHLVADRFTAADLMMVAVLRMLRVTDLLAKVPVLDAYKQRGEARPAFQRALRDQTRHFEANGPGNAGA